MQLLEGFILGILSLVGLLLVLGPKLEKTETTLLTIKEKIIKEACADQAILDEDDQMEWWKRELFKARERYLR